MGVGSWLTWSNEIIISAIIDKYDVDGVENLTTVPRLQSVRGKAVSRVGWKHSELL